MKVQSGLERLLQGERNGVVEGRIGLLCNQASVDRHLRHAKELIATAFPGRLTALFSPQHGLYAEKQDNMVESQDGFDHDLEVPVFSLYGQYRQPQPHHLDAIDVLLIDLQDVGCRVYTFIWTMLLVMEACARHGKRVVVLDRPNPIGGQDVEGNLLDPGLFSFVGLFPLPMRHGMTIGELALMFRDRMGLNLDLEVVPMTGWKRETLFPQTGLPWVWPSPNMPGFDTTLVYPGQVLLEGTNLSEGRGTTRPFEVFGAPWLDPRALARTVTKSGLQGFVIREQRFEPTFHKWKGEICIGFQIHVTDPARYRPYLTSLSILGNVIRLHRDDFQWRPPPYEYEYKKLPIDLIIGNRNIRKGLEEGADIWELEAEWREELDQFKEMRQDWLLY